MKKIFVLAGSFLLLAACNQFGKKREVKGKDRIVCVSKQLTEIMFALHQGDKIIGLDLTSSYPPETKDITKVGYHRHLNAEGIISLDPTVVIHQNDVAPPEVMQQLKKVGVPIKIYPAANSIDSTKWLISAIAKEYGVDSAADRINKKLDEDLAKARAIVNQYQTKPRVLIIHFGQQRNQYFVMGTRGTADAMLKMAGGINAADTSSFRDLSPEIIAREQPDVILATDFGWDRMGGSIEKFKELPGISLTPAAKNGKIFRIEEHDLVYFGPRSGENILNMAKLIHQ
jgi:iron complex transport system substrate-binding protein